MLEKARRRLYQLLNGGHRDDLFSQALNIFITVLIILNVVAVVLESMSSVRVDYHRSLDIFEFVSVALFTAEYLMRVWSSVEDQRYAHPIMGRIKYCFSLLALVDLIVILPFYLSGVSADLRVLRMLRLFRLLRLLKLVRYLPALQVFANALTRRSGELAVALALMILLLIFASSLMYYAERTAQPTQFSSIPTTMWWAVATLGKVSYGDIKPITALGKVLAGIISILGIAVFALPAGILGSAFIEEIQQKKKIAISNSVVCPHCGKGIDDIS